MTTTTERLLGGRVSGTRRLLHAPPLAAFAIDLVLIGGSILTAAELRQTGVLLDSESTVNDLTGLGVLMTLGWIGLISLRGGYERDVFSVGTDEYRRVASASGLVAGMVGIGCYLAKYELSRGFFVFVFVVGVPALLLGRLLLRRALQRAHMQGHLRRRVLLVGTTHATDDIARVLQRETWLGYEVLGALTPATELESETATGVPVLGNADEATELAPLLDADMVFFGAGGMTSSGQMRRTLWALEDHDIHVVVAPNMTDMASERIKIRPVGGLPLIHVGKPRATQALSWGKRGFDFTASLVLLVLASPLLLFAALRIVAHDGGPVLFRQERVGREGTTFSCLKLRTMVPDAEQRLEELHEQEGHTEGLFKMAEDPRVTKPGRWLRRYSVDELPQLWNVLRGDMSLVGPRPPLTREVAAYDLVARRRLRVRPGMTGLWQVSGRSNLTWNEAIRLDVYYVDNWSVLQDVSILLKTFRAVLRSEGAY